MNRVWPTGAADTKDVPCQREDRVIGLTSGSAKPIIYKCLAYWRIVAYKTEIQNHAGTPTANPINSDPEPCKPFDLGASNYDSQHAILQLSVPSGRVPFKVAQP